MRLRTTFLWSMIISLTLSAILGIIAILAEKALGETGEHILFTALLVGAYSLVCLACAFVLDRRRAIGVMWTGIGASFIALAVWLFLIWFDWWIGYEAEEPIAKTGGTFTIICIWSAHFGLLWMLKLTRKWWVQIKMATVICAGCLSALFLQLMWFELDDEWMLKTIAILSILTSCGTVVTPILALISKLQAKAEPAALESRVVISVTCPRCDTTQQLPAKKSKCSTCGLRIDIRIEEPRCGCGYLLYRLQGGKCPECGREIPEKDRWAAVGVAPQGETEPENSQEQSVTEPSSETGGEQ